jgi:hypothetical protein
MADDLGTAQQDAPAAPAPAIDPNAAGGRVLELVQDVIGDRGTPAPVAPVDLSGVALSPGTEEADHHKTASMFREEYAGAHGFPSYLDFHFAVLHPSTPSDVAEHHLRETDMGSARHFLNLTAASAPEVESQPTAQAAAEAPAHEQQGATAPIDSDAFNADFSLRRARRRATEAVESLIFGKKPDAPVPPSDLETRKKDGESPNAQQPVRRDRVLEADRRMAEWFQEAEARAKAAADSPDNLGVLGHLGLMTKEEQDSWLAGEKVAAEQSLKARRDALDRANAAVDIFEKGAPGKTLHPWLAERQKFARVALRDAEDRTAKVGEMEAGERSLATKNAWRAAIEQAASGAVRGGTRIAMSAEVLSEVQREMNTQVDSEGRSVYPDGRSIDMSHMPMTDTIVHFGNAIAAKARELFPGDPARQHEVTQVLANRAAGIVGLIGGLGAAGAKNWWKKRRARKAVKGDVE